MDRKNKPQRGRFVHEDGEASVCTQQWQVKGGRRVLNLCLNSWSPFRPHMENSSHLLEDSMLIHTWSF